MRTQPPLYRKVGGLRFLRLGRLQLSFCICRPVPAKVTATRADIMMAAIRRHNAERTAIQEVGPYPCR